MKLLSFISLLVFVSCNTGNSDTQAQVNKEYCDTMQIDSIKSIGCCASVFFNCESHEKVDIFDNYHNRIRTLSNDFENENFLLFKLLNKNDSMFHVVAYWALDGKEIAKGWIYRNNDLGIFSAAYTGHLILYEEPCNKDKIVAIDEYNPDMYEVVDFCKDWLKIKARINSKLYYGWIPPEMQCWNVYSTCN